jgi:pimeloyl-ACP methyl ester carboxylesterase
MKSRYNILRNGLKIHSLVADNNSFPPLILLHGYPTNAYLWRECIPSLSKKFQVYAPDLPGHGKSDKPLDAKYDLDFFINFLKEYYNTLCIEKAHLVVHDLGGMIGLGFASRYPEKINKFVVMDTLPYKELPKGMQEFYNAVRSPILSRVLLFKPVFTNSLFRDKSIVYDKNKIKSDIIKIYHSQWTKDKKCKKAFSKVLSASIDSFTEPKNHLTFIKAPTLILWAENDKAMGIDIAKKLVSDIPNSQLEIIPECGHYLPEEQPEIITEKILKFL